MAEADDKPSISAEHSPRQEPYTDPEETRRPPRFGEPEPTVHIVSEKVHLQPTSYTKGIVEGIRITLQRLLSKRRRRPFRDPVEHVAKELWPPTGKPPEALSTPEALRQLWRELERQSIHVSDDTMRRAIDRR